MKAKLLVAFLLFLFPSSFCKHIFSLFKLTNIHLGNGCRIGFSIIISPQINIGDNAHIGHLNFVRVNSFYLGPGGGIKYFNMIKGKIDVVLEFGCSIHSFNKVSGWSVYKPNYFVVGKNSQIVLRHLFNVSDSIEIGESTCLAGAGTQIWTHSYLFGKEKHIRVDGSVKIGSNCYIGSRVVICPGVTITDNVMIGANTTISKDIEKPGLYVSQPIRYIEYDPDEQIKALGDEVSPGICRKTE